MFKIFHQTNQQINEDNYVEKETKLKNILNYLFKLDYYLINRKYDYEKYYNKQNTIYIKIENSNKIQNTLIKLNYWYNNCLNNLPLHLKWLYNSKVNCNLPPNLIYLSCNYCDINNLPKSLTFLFTRINIYNEIILNNINIKKYVIKLLYDYVSIISINNIKFKTWEKHFYHFLYILK